MWRPHRTGPPSSGFSVLLSVTRASAQCVCSQYREEHARTPLGPRAPGPFFFSGSAAGPLRSAAPLPGRQLLLGEVLVLEMWRRLSQTLGLGGTRTAVSPALCIFALRYFRLYSGRRQNYRFALVPFPGSHLPSLGRAVQWECRLTILRMRALRVIWMLSLGIMRDRDTYLWGSRWPGRVAAGGPVSLAARTWKRWFWLAARKTWCVDSWAFWPPLRPISTLAFREAWGVAVATAFLGGTWWALGVAIGSCATLILTRWARWDWPGPAWRQATACTQISPHCCRTRRF